LRNKEKLTIIASKRVGKRKTLQTKITVNDLYDATLVVIVFYLRSLPLRRNKVKMHPYIKGRTKILWLAGVTGR